jgi:hypothetical protein
MTILLCPVLMCKVTLLSVLFDFEEFNLLQKKDCKIKKVCDEDMHSVFPGRLLVQTDSDTLIVD